MFTQAKPNLSRICTVYTYSTSEPKSKLDCKACIRALATCLVVCSGYGTGLIVTHCILLSGDV